MPAMGCSITCHKTFLVCCNVMLLFVSLSIFILGFKMKWAMSVLLLLDIPIVLKAVKAVIAAGFFMFLTSISGICGACYEWLPLLITHLILLGIIVIMEFSLGITLMMVKKTIENELASFECNNMCIAAVDAAILEYALPSAGLMVAVIFIEAAMIYCTGRLYFYVRDKSKMDATQENPADVRQYVQMQNVAAAPTTYDPPPSYVDPPPPPYVGSPPPTYVARSSSTYIAPPPSTCIAPPHSDYVTTPQPAYVASPQSVYVATQPAHLPQVNINSTHRNFTFQ